MDIRQEWQQIRRIEAGLPAGDDRDGSQVIVSTDKGGQNAGIFFDVVPLNAARCIHSGSHRLATPEEIAQYREKQRVDAEAVRLEVLKSKQQMVVPMDPALFQSHFQPVPEAARQPQKRT